MAGRARGAELLEPRAVLAVAGVAALAARRRLALAERPRVAALALDLRVLGDQRIAGLLLVIEPHLGERAQRRRVAALALLRAEQLAVVRALVTLRAVAVEPGQLEHRFRVALGARDVGVRADERHRGEVLVVVIEVEARARRLPLGLAVAAIAAQVGRADRTVRLILGVAAAAVALGVEVGAQPLLVGRLVAVRAARDRVLALELPAGELVVERLAAADRAPPHQIEAPA